MGIVIPRPGKNKAIYSSCSPQLNLCIIRGFRNGIRESAGSHPLREVQVIECVAGRGVRDDRFFDYKENYKGQIKFFQVKSSKKSVVRLAFVTNAAIVLLPR